MGKLGWAAASLLLALVLATGGCASTATSEASYHDSGMDFGQIQTVAVMPFENLSSVSQAGERVRDVFMTRLQATGSLYVLPPGEVLRGISRGSVQNPVAPNAEEVISFAKVVGADVVITGTVIEYGEVRSGTASANAISVSLRMLEAQTGKVVWSGSATEGGVSTSDRLFGGGGRPMDTVTERAVGELLQQLFD